MSLNTKDCCPIDVECRRRPLGAPKMLMCQHCPCHPFAETLIERAMLRHRGEKEENAIPSSM